LGVRVPVKLDRIDRSIVSLLVEDGRMSSAEITRRVGHVSERSVR
jgi:DNA-binding Lrp family transcriptional regulator